MLARAPDLNGGSSNFLNSIGRAFTSTEGSIIDRFLRQVSVKSYEAAVSSSDTTMSYVDLNELSLRLARQLVLRSLDKESIILCRFHKSPWAVVSFLGILRAGLAFTPVDPSYPAARVRQIAKDTGSTLILESEDGMGEIGGVGSWKIDTQFFHSIPSHLTVQLPTIERKDLAYVYFTSGSTGHPKGVMVEHGSICTSLVAHGKRLGMCSTSRVLQATSYVFDPCLTEIFATLIYGGCICVPQDLTRLVSSINELAVSRTPFQNSSPFVHIPPHRHQER